MTDDTFLSFVLLKELRPLAPAALISAVNAKLGEVGAQAVIESAAGDAGPIVINIVGRRFTILVVNKPVPTRDLQESIALERSWRDVDASVAQHTAHIIVAPMDKPSSHSAAVSSAIFTTLLAASIAELEPAIGIWWSTGAKLMEATAFVQQASGIANKRIPILAWLQLVFLAAPDGRGTAIVTIGLRPFIGRELEWQPSPAPAEVAAKRVLGVASYLIANGLVVKDGETIGLSEEEKIAVRYADYGHRAGVPVLRLFATDDGMGTTGQGEAPFRRRAN